MHTPAILHLNIGLAGSNGNNKPNAQLTVTQLNSSGWVYTDVDVRKSQLVKSKSFARLSRAVNYPRATLVINHPGEKLEFRISNQEPESSRPEAAEEAKKADSSDSSSDDSSDEEAKKERARRERKKEERQKKKREKKKRKKDKGRTDSSVKIGPDV